MAGVAWLPAMAAIVLFAAGAIGAGVAIVVGAIGGLTVLVIAMRLTISRPIPRLRPDAELETGSWLEVADPRSNHAARWAMYGDLTERLRQRDWTGKVVAEFGGTNALLRPFIAGAEYVHLEYPRYDIQDLRDVEAGQFDLALLDQTLEHIADPERAMREIHRVLKPGGIAVVTTPFLIPVHTAESYGDYTRWTPQGMRTMLERNGFDADVRYWGNQRASIAILDDMYMYAGEARQLGLDISLGDLDDRYPVTVWALATAVAAAAVRS